MQFDAKQVAHARPYPPLGTIWAAALLREHGFEVSLFDTMFAEDPDDILMALQGFKPDVLVIYDDGFNYLTKMCLSNMREAAFRMQFLAKESGCKVVTASSDASDHFEQYLEQGADFVISGEAEYTLLELVSGLEKGQKDLDDLPGLIYLQYGAPHKTLKRTVSRRLDDLPLPAWDLVDIRPYREMWTKKQGYFSINIATTRGCPYHCNWCAKPLYGNNYNMRSAENVIAEIKLLKEKFNMDHIWFCDDIFGLKRSWVSQFANLVNGTGLKTAFKIQSRADLLTQENYVHYLADAGCEEVWLGAESGSQKILDAMDKGTTVLQIKTARSLLKQYGIRTAFFLQYGYLGETMEDIRQTLDLIKETMPDDIGISVSYPLPGTSFYERVKQELRAKTNWTDSDDLAMMFHNTFPTLFYKKLHRYTHYIYRFQMLKRNNRFSVVKYVRLLRYYLLQLYYSMILHSYKPVPN
jgi:anaerobic magnesium-protoporphyrin IX monomethyl ester cyclase